MGAGVLKTHDNLFDFFHEEVDAATEQTGETVSEEGVFYLSNLLLEQTRIPDADAPQTLVELQILATQGTRTQAIRNFRALGDRALYVSGFFPESLARRAVKDTYYADMGRAAYERLSKMLSVSTVDGAGDGGHKSLADIFGELADSFVGCIHILREVHAAMSGRSPAEPTEAELLRMYEEWLTTGNQQVLRKLQRHGLLAGSQGGLA